MILYMKTPRILQNLSRSNKKSSAKSWEKDEYTKIKVKEKTGENLQGLGLGNDLT